MSMVTGYTYAYSPAFHARPARAFAPLKVRVGTVNEINNRANAQKTRRVKWQIRGLNVT